MAFTVISPVDLNQNPRVKEPFKLSLEKSFCCFCCKSGPLSLIVSLPVTGFVSGQTIPILAECDNASNVKVNAVKFTLRKVVAFRKLLNFLFVKMIGANGEISFTDTNQPRRETKRDKITIAELSVGPVEEHGSQTWQQKLDIPPLPPSNLVNCGIIDLDYEMKVSFFSIQPISRFS